VVTTRSYYNQRVGDGRPPQLTLEETASLIEAAYRVVDEKGYLQRDFGFWCTDVNGGDIVPGRVGTDLRMEFYLRTGIRIENSVNDAFINADEVTLFTLVEFVHDYVAKPGKHAGWHHTWNNCGWHYDHQQDTFDDAAGRAEWRTKVNAALLYYGDGYELRADGEVIHLPPSGMEKLTSMAAPAGAQPTDASKLVNAIHSFQLGRASREQRKHAVRELVDILEYHRPVVKAHLSEDESDLFNIANNFALRHHRVGQKDDYDDAWLTWLFYVYLATAHLVLGRAAGTVPFANTLATTDDEIPF